ncbi:hypothetical protein DYB34_009344 [Aphanomyces astaci]|uniref:Chromatin-remodeling ATPase INO80 n=1 Tax=Aphanomyces astaci TaxID=112090 RepID=A0A418BQC1_APHAT|nr:hypothetical protein DYB34_009344 [Aphanomyces astaci]
MARSSTRKALSGGNFMGMMNVLMQLRKVCNHPDLFEARPILCPFDMAPLTVSYPFANLAVGRHRRTLGCFYPDNGLVTSEVACEARRTLAPSIQVFIDDVSMTPVEKEEQEWLRQYATLFSFVTQQKTLRQAATRAKATANAWINHWRCMETTPFITHELLRIATMPVFISPAMDVHNKVGKATSTALAAMVQSPTSRLNNWLEIMLKVLCFVHKARTTAPTLVVGSTLSAGRVQDALHSKETNDQRQHLYFPDKRLIQFDCGKLQQLDRLLRELKRGSHRCLIFSQMSSMLNILEIFLNVHG